MLGLLDGVHVPVWVQHHLHSWWMEYSCGCLVLTPWFNWWTTIVHHSSLCVHHWKQHKINHMYYKQILGESLVHRHPGWSQTRHCRYQIAHHVKTWPSFHRYPDDHTKIQTTLRAPFPACHDNLGHFRAEKSYANLHDNFYWSNIRRDFANSYVVGCPDCQCNKASTTKQADPLHSLPILDK